MTHDTDCSVDGLVSWPSLSNDIHAACEINTPNDPSCLHCVSSIGSSRFHLKWRSMSDSFAEDPFGPGSVGDPQPAARRPLTLIAQYGLALLFVALATALAFVVQHLISAPNLTLIYVLPVIIAATLFGWGPSLLAVVVGVAAFDFFFTEPYYSLTISSPSDIWAAVLLFVIASIVTSVAAKSRRRAIEAGEAAERAQALQAVAHAVIGCRPQLEILQTAATALHRIFRAPAAILMQREDHIEAVATAGSAQIIEADRDAARGALSSHVNTRGETYPYERTYFDFWPVLTRAGCNCALGVDFAHAARERPASPEQVIEVVAAYVAAALVMRE
jgi:K+-sensing histidine kinase KdpD